MLDVGAGIAAAAAAVHTRRLKAKSCNFSSYLSLPSLARRARLASLVTRERERESFMPRKESFWILPTSDSSPSLEVVAPKELKLCAWAIGHTVVTFQFHLHPFLGHPVDLLEAASFEIRRPSVELARMSASHIKIRESVSERERERRSTSSSVREGFLLGGDYLKRGVAAVGAERDS